MNEISVHQELKNPCVRVSGALILSLGMVHSSVWLSLLIMEII